jgi:hypothetical protein
MKAIRTTIITALALLISSCNFLAVNASTSTTEEANILVTPEPSANKAYPLLKTTLGDFVIMSVRLVDKAHEDKAPDGYKYLLISLARPDLQKLVAGEFSFESFQSAFGNDKYIYILGDDGSQTPYGGMGGWLDNNEPIADDFVMGFLVPLAETYTLYWTNNPPYSLSIEQ